MAKQSMKSVSAILFYLCVVSSLAATARAELIISDFNSSPIGSGNPRDNWFGFGAGSADFGITVDGSIGRGAYHVVDWASSTWGVGEISLVAVDVSAEDRVTLDARIVDLGGLTGTPLIRFALDMPGGSEYSTPSVPLSGSYQTYSFDFTDLLLTIGGEPLDLSAGKPKLVFDKNGQTGLGQIDFDEIVARPAASATFNLTPVALYAPWDGDAVRAMWLYSFPDSLRVDDAVAAQAVLDFAASEGVNRIYFSAYEIWGLGSNQLKDNLRTFIQTAHASGIRVEASICSFTLQQFPSIVQSLIDSILAIHDATPADMTDDFDAIHYDVEFWVDASWTGTEAQRQQIARDYFDNVLVNARNHLDANGGGAITLSVDLSAHFDTPGMLPAAFFYNGTTQFFLEHVLDLVDDVILMSYLDTPGGLFTITVPELDMAVGKGRMIQLAVDVEPVPPEVPINSFADNFTPTPYSAMTKAIQDLHAALTPERLGALEGFSIFHYDGYRNHTPPVRSFADLDGDEDIDVDDFDDFAGFMNGPDMPVSGIALDADLQADGSVDLKDFAQFQICFTGPGMGPPADSTCNR